LANSAARHPPAPHYRRLQLGWREYALTGSTEWGEQFADDLKKKLVAYLNVDESVAGAATTAGPEGLSFSPPCKASLAPMLVEASKTFARLPEKSLYEAWRPHDPRFENKHSRRSTAPSSKRASAAGSDHTVFLNHLGGQ